ncbi:hypothetical protein BO94DRAFT_594846 [Aspergillus sclerotioniger CBS 115572]|uniref:Uncharacterized protein n=1 Tax=Aspergillus sclerotioniger CBS 115572 TaxID=1450535 RepID=A0A317WU10_9EURO|nr:hypothetical protein BO94DRAFT_594846 [Aspergillus sclerotioniger CBS 115572]PWY88667.1 hypothetical protein BO94DRAFT_594846 [Aspergillus sclerotioniger CBS 115572]
MVCCLLHHNIGHSSNNNGTDNSVSFCLDSDNTINIDFLIDITDITTLTYLYSKRWYKVTPAVPDTLSNSVPSRSPTALAGVAKQNDNSDTSSITLPMTLTRTLIFGSSRKIDRLSNLKTQVISTRNRPLHAPLQRVREGMGDKSMLQSIFHSKPIS